MDTNEYLDGLADDDTVNFSAILHVSQCACVTCQHSRPHDHTTISDLRATSDEVVGRTPSLLLYTPVDYYR